MELESLQRISSARIVDRIIRVSLQLSSPSKIPGMPTRSMGMPSSASASIFSGCCFTRRDEKLAEV